MSEKIENIPYILIPLSDGIVYYNTFTKDVEEAKGEFEEFKDILEEQGYITMADWNLRMDSDYYTYKSDETLLFDMGLGWKSIDSFSIKKGAGFKDRGIKDYLYIFADNPIQLNNLNEAIDKLIEEQEWKIKDIQQKINKLRSMKTKE